MNDIELQALAILVMAEAIEREGTNGERLMKGEAIAYMDDTPWPNRCRLEIELRKRQIAE